MKIILATDGTKLFESEIEILKILNLNETSEIWIIFVIDMAVQSSIDVYADYFLTAKEIENVVLENAVKVLNLTKKRIEKMFVKKNVSIFTEILHGSPDSRVVEKAEEIQSDLIIVGSHGHNRWESLLLGSVSESIIHRSRCSVLVVKNS